MKVRIALDLDDDQRRIIAKKVGGKRCATRKQVVDWVKEMVEEELGSATGDDDEIDDEATDEEEED